MSTRSTKNRKRSGVPLKNENQILFIFSKNLIEVRNLVYTEIDSHHSTYRPPLPSQAKPPAQPNGSPLATKLSISSSQIGANCT